MLKGLTLMIPLMITAIHPGRILGVVGLSVFALACSSSRTASDGAVDLSAAIDASASQV